MPKNKVSEWSSTASNNTDIGGINVAEGCAPSGINNAIRELMAQVKDMQTGADGDGLVVGGAFTCSGNAVFSGTIVGTSATFTNLVLSTPLGVASGGSPSTTSTGTGSVVLSASPALTGTPTAPTAAAGTSNTQIATTAFASAVVPAGTVIHVAMSSAPSGYLKCNGQAVSRSTYSALFSAIGTTYGSGDGSSTFNVPDLRGEFIRGWDDGRGVDSGRAIGTSQGHAFQDHHHRLYGMADSSPSGNTNKPPSADNGLTTNGFTVDSAVQEAITGNVASETRPRNIALLACIKF